MSPILFWTTVVFAFRQLLRNKTRSALTSLGILICVAAVIAMVSISKGATVAVERSLASIGQDVVFCCARRRAGLVIGHHEVLL
jgi:putative ABC transport system permease protein